MEHDTETIRELITLLREKDAQQAEMVKILAQNSQAQSDVFRSWMELFKPPAEPLRSSTPDSRAAQAELEDATAWEPLSPHDVAALLQSELT